MDVSKMGKLYDLATLETILGVNRKTLTRYIHDGKLQAFKLGQKWKVSENALSEFLEIGKGK